MALLPLLPLLGYETASWSGVYAPHQLLGLLIHSSRFANQGVLPGDKAILLKVEFARFSDGDLVAVVKQSEVFLERFPAGPDGELLGKIIRVWRDYH